MGQKKTISILGATGSIGQSTADVIASAPDRFSVCTVTAHEDAAGLKAVAERLGAKHAILSSETPETLEEAVKPDTDLTVAAISGIAGLKPLMHAIKNSKAVAIANKEPLVAAGAIVIREAQKHGTKILPIDSEHNAVFQVFDDAQRAAVRRIILTASGGPFLNWSAEDVAKATPEQAVAHPNWDMGAKISVDSASMMNKALEIIEANVLFGLPADQIDVVIHPQSVVHSMVEYADGSVLAQMGASDMRTPIAYALGWPDRIDTPGERLDVTALSKLEFQKPDPDQFPALQLAYDSIGQGQNACLAMNAANEVAVEAFLRNEIGFSVILDIVRFALERVPDITLDDIDSVERADRLVREGVVDHFNLTYPRSSIQKKAV